MLPRNLPSTLIGALLGLATVVACTAPPSAIDQPAPDVIIYSSVQQWLALQRDVAGMDSEELSAALAQEMLPRSGDKLYYYALLLQQSPKYDDWVSARDAFRQLYADEALSEPQRQLADIFLAYNQLRINGYQRQSELQEDHASLESQLHQAEQDKRRLEQKIQALTELETAISTRRKE